MIRTLFKKGKRIFFLTIMHLLGWVFAIKGVIKGYDSITLDNFISKAYIETDAIEGIYDSGFYPFLKEFVCRSFAMLK